jgi:precorrin-3B synthase
VSAAVRSPSTRDTVDACPGVFAPHDAADGALARIRLPGGVIGASALRAVADCAEELGDGHVHLTSRGNLQLRGLSRSGAVVGRLVDAGLLPSATHERVRNVLASPLSGIAAGDPALGTSVAQGAAGDPAFGTSTAPVRALDVPNDGSRGGTGVGSCDVRGLAAALDRGLCARPALADLPGRFLFAVDDGRGDVAAEEPDLCWQAPDRLLVAGVHTGLRIDATDAVDALLDAAEAFLALRAADGGNAWRAAELVDAPARIAAALRGSDGGRRGSQHGGFAPVGVQQSHHAAESGAAGSGAAESGAAESGGALLPGPVRRTDGGLALVVAPLLGELTATQVRLLADAGPVAVVTPWRSVVLPDPRVPADELAAAGLVVAPGPASDLSACAGRPGCAKALADVRADARAALGRLPAGRIHVSGCARRCGAPHGPHIDAVALAEGGYLVDGVPQPELVP